MSQEKIPNVLNIILTHQSPAAIERMLDWWKDRVPLETVLLMYGGPAENFEAIVHRWKVFIDDKRLRTRDHQRELQSYTQLFHAVDNFLQHEAKDFEFIHFAEYDHLPIVPDLNTRQIERLKEERADVIGFHLHRVDGTSNAHFLYHASNEKFNEYWSRITCREEPEVVLSMFGSGSFWKREAFAAVASQTEPFPIYMEIFLPTVAHHLGFRVRDYGTQDEFVGVLKDKTAEIDKARKRGAWTLHPVKSLQNAYPAAPHTAAKMKSNLEWEKWGEIDPLYAVATWKDKQRGSEGAWTDKEFYELGRKDWALFEMQWKQYGIRSGYCLEIGCGAGRMTTHLAKSFDHVTAVDVSQHQLDYATRHIQAGNVSFKITDGIHLPPADNTVDAVFSVHVFQHFDSHNDALQVFREIYRVLTIGGTLMIGLPIYKLPDSTLRTIFRPMINGFEHLSDLKAAFNRQLILKGKWRPMMRRLRFEQAWLSQALSKLGFRRIEFRCFVDEAGGELVDFLFATRPE